MVTETSSGLVHPVTLAAEGLFLVSFWKPLILLVTLGLWAHVVSRVYDKHAARFFLPRERWNTIHLIAGVLAFGVALAMPIFNEGAFWAGWGAMVVILAIDLAAYPLSANKDSRVPEAFHIRLSGVTNLFKKSESAKAAKGQAPVKLAIRGADKQLVAPPQLGTPEAEVRATAEEVYLKAMENRAAQVDLGPGGKDGAYVASMLVDGLRVAGQALPPPAALKVIDFWKAAAKLDVADRRRKLVGDVVVEQAGNRKTVRLTSIGVQGGMRLTMLFDPAAAVKRSFDELGLLEAQAAELRELIADPARGVVLLAGVPDGGRSTLMYTILQQHDAYTQTVQTVETEPQIQLEGVRHQAFDATAEGADYGTLVRSMLRRDPDTLGIAEMPDANTAKEVAKADQERTRQYLVIRAEGAMEALDFYVKAVGEPALAARGLRGVVAVRLVRKLCTNCRVSYPPTPDMLKKLGLEAGKVQALFKKGGQVLIKDKPAVCPVCAGVGYVGQEGLLEVYRFGDEERDLIAQNNLPGVRANLRKRGLPTILQVAVRKAVAGATSVDEIQRVLGGGPPAAGAPKAAAPAAPPA